MDTISQVIKNISFAAIIISVILLLVPLSGIGKSARKAIIFILIIFIITAISGQKIKIEEFDYQEIINSTTYLIGSETETAIKTQLYALFKENGIYYKKVEVMWHLQDDKICVDEIKVWSKPEYKEKIKLIIKQNYNINGEVYESN